MPRFRKQPVEIEASSAGVSRTGWALSEVVYLMAGALEGRVAPTAIAKAASLRVAQVGRGDGRHDLGVPAYHVGRDGLELVDIDRITAGRKLRDTRGSLSWAEVSSGLAGVVPEMVDGTVGQALAAMRAELVEAGGGHAEPEDARPVRKARKPRAKPGPEVTRKRAG